jgi:uncharacterized protein (DUF58 family)
MTESAREDAAWLDYGVRWRTGESRPGRYMARQAGTGGALRGTRPFWQVPDVRRIDVRRSILDPAGGLVVRQMENRGSITVIVAADVSRSMQARPGATKLGCVLNLVQAASRTAHRAGDAFGFVGFDATVRADRFAAPSRSRGPALAVLSKLARLVPDGRSAAGIADLAAHLPEKRSLILLISDFLIPLDMLEAGLQRLGRHDVAPIVLHDAREAALPSGGLVRLRDAETGGTRLLVMRPGLRARWMRQSEAWQARLDALFLNHCRPGFHVHGALDIAALGQHLWNG